MTVVWPALCAVLSVAVAAWAFANGPLWLGLLLSLGPLVLGWAAYINTDRGMRQWALARQRRRVDRRGAR